MQEATKSLLTNKFLKQILIFFGILFALGLIVAVLTYYADTKEATQQTINKTTPKPTPVKKSSANKK